MLDNLTQRFTHIVKTLRGHARLTESNTQDILREVRIALLEADVALPVIKDFIAKVKEAALGEDVIGSLTPGQAFVSIVKRELTLLMGGNDANENELNLSTQPPAVILMAGLQGAGKTTTVAKLARHLQEKKKKVLTVSCDVYRPAAIDQLKTVTEQAGASWFASEANQKPLDIARDALAWSKSHHYDVLIVDTAGRLGIDTDMMNEITALHKALQPIETLFVMDAMLGQDAVNTAKAFNEALPLTGVILTKLDGDARGGAALSVRHITGKPIKFVGTSEKIDGLGVFYAERLAERILGMGDVLSLVEEAHKSMDIAATEKLAKKIKKGDAFDLNDFLSQISQMNKVGGLGGLLNKLPAQFQAMAGAANNSEQMEKQMRRMEGILNSMTPKERALPDLIKASRKRRIATGAGVPVQEVNRLLAQYEDMRSMMKKMKGGGMMKMMRSMKGMMPGAGGRGPF